MTHAERAYYEHRAPEYDDWWLGTGLFAQRDRPGWHEEVETLRSVVGAIAARTVLDVACGTGFLTRHLPGHVTAMDQSAAMLALARTRLPQAQIIRSDALRLPFQSASFECLAAAHFYGHLQEPQRREFLKEARRVAARILMVDAALRDGVAPEEMQERTLNDGSHHTVYKRYFDPDQLRSELGGGELLHAGRWFVAVLA